MVAFSREKTLEALDDDGWLHSGDLIREDDEAFFKVVGRIKEILEAHNHDLNVLSALETSGEEIVTGAKFRIQDVFRKPVLQPFLITVTLTILFQFSGQGAVTFYTVQIFTVSSLYK